jgi:ABC-2 type transport system permease protein
MSSFLVLLRMQLYLRLSALKPSHWVPKHPADFKEWKPLLMGLLFLVIIASVESTVLLMANGILSGFMQMKIPDLLLSTVIMICMALTLLVGFFHVTSILFFSRDSAFLSGLPVSSRTVMAVRLSVVLLGEMALTALVFLPVCVLYGIRTGQNALFYIKAVITAPLIPCMPLAAATLLALLLIHVSSLFRHRDRWAVIGGFVLIALVIPLQMQFYSRIPSEAGADFFMRILSDNRAMLEGFLSGLPPVLWATAGVTGQGEWSLLYLLLFIASSAAAAVLPLLVGGGRYLQLAILQNEAFQNTKHRKLTARDYNLARSPLKALIIREWKEVLRVPAYALNGLIGIVMMPIMMVALFLGMKGSSELTAFLGGLFRSAGGVNVTLIAAAAMAAVSTINMAGATAVSREGKRMAITRIIPIPYATQILAKHLFGFSINFLTCLTTVIALIILIPSQTMYILAAFVMGLLFGYAANAMSLALDASHPKLNWRNETEAIKQNAMALLSMFLGVAAAGLMGIAVWLLWQAGVSLSILAILLTVLLTILAIAAHAFLLKKADVWYSRGEL